MALAQAFDLALTFAFIRAGVEEGNPLIHTIGWPATIAAKSLLACAIVWRAKRARLDPAIGWFLAGLYAMALYVNVVMLEAVT